MRRIGSLLVIALVLGGCSSETPEASRAMERCSPDAVVLDSAAGSGVEALIEVCGDALIPMMNELAASKIDQRIRIVEGTLGTDEFGDCVHTFFAERAEADVLVSAEGAGTLADVISNYADSVEGVCVGNAGPLVPGEVQEAADFKERLLAALDDPDEWEPIEANDNPDIFTGRNGTAWFMLSATPDGEFGGMMAGDEAGSNAELRNAVFRAANLTDPGGPIESARSENNVTKLCVLPVEVGWEVMVFPRAIPIDC